jgi:branched-subunit amino acid transport protein AzlD
VPDTAYILAVLAITFMITYSLRTVPCAALGTLRESTLVQDLAVWMPVGILGILAVTAFRGSVLALPGTAVPALIAAAASVVVHLILGRRTLLSVGTGAAVYAALVNMS